jgi:nitrite reductase/ring-hydroxylating ferredoxin subunit
MSGTHWVRIAPTVEALPFNPNQLCAVEVEGKPICLGRHGEQYFAFAATCPHAGAPFAEGFIDPLGNVVCPKHRYKFVMRNGYNCSGEGFKLKTYPIQVNDEGVFIGLH